MEIILKCMQTAILTTFNSTLSNLLYAFCITRLNTKYLFLFEVYSYSFSLVNMLQNVQNPINVLTNFHQYSHNCIVTIV